LHNIATYKNRILSIIAKIAKLTIGFCLNENNFNKSIIHDYVVD